VQVRFVFYRALFFSFLRSCALANWEIGVFEIMEGQKKALEWVLLAGKGEKRARRTAKRAMLRAVKNHATGDAAQVEEAAVAADAAEAAEENESSLAEVDKTADASQQAEVSQGKAWEDELADRTK
jgi:hypothetical protein